MHRNPDAPATQLRPVAFSGGLPPMFVRTRRLVVMSVASLSLLAMATPAWPQTRPATPAAPPTHPAAPGAPAAATGRISGRALEQGKDPVSFANVIVLGTKQGTMTDEPGAFLI